ncbi:MAG TPA: AsmA family protein [Deltaproteobacteria bacterium]|nr:AsmA family protein [Deltaproteobacteria bacterium]
MKKILIVASLVAALVVGILAALPFAIDLNRHKASLIALIAKYTDRRVDFERIDLTVLTGLGARIKGLRVSDDPRFSAGDFLSLDEVRVKVALLPLLRKEIRVRELSFVRPSVMLVRGEDAKLNVSTLVKPGPGKKEEGKESVLGGVMAAGLKVKDGKLVFVDKRPGKAGGAITLSDVDLDVDTMDPARPTGFTLSASLMGTAAQNLNVMGSVGPLPGRTGAGPLPIDMQVVIDPLMLGSLPIGKNPLAGGAKVKASAKGDLAGVVDARVEADFTGLSLAGRKGGVDASCSFRAAYDGARGGLLVKEGAFTTPGGKGNFTIQLKDMKTDPSLSLNVSSASFAPAPLLEGLGLGRAQALGKVKVSGPMAFRIEAHRSKGSIRVRASVDMRQAALAYGTFFDKPASVPMAASLRMAGTPETISIESFEVAIERVGIHGSGRLSKEQGGRRLKMAIATESLRLADARALVPVLKKYSPEGVVVAKAEMESGAKRPFTLGLKARSDRVALVLGAKGDRPAQGAKVLEAPARAELDSVDLSLDAVGQKGGPSVKGTVLSRGGVFMKIPYSRLSADFVMRDQAFTVTSFDMKTLKGSLKGGATYDLKTREYTVNPVFTNLQASDLMDSLTAFKGVFSGAMTGALELSGNASRPAMETLGARGKIQIANGQWKNFDLAGQVLSSVLGVPGAGEILGLVRSEVQRYETTQFESMETNVDLDRKVVRIGSMRLMNIASGRDTDTESNLRGTISMETQAVDLKGVVVLPKRFSQKATARAEAFREVMNDQGRLVLPVSIGGTIKRPIPTVDVRKLSGALARYYTTKALEKGVQRLRERAPVPPGAQEETRRAIEETIEGLFKKKK